MSFKLKKLPILMPGFKTIRSFEGGEFACLVRLGFKIANQPSLKCQHTDNLLSTLFTSYSRAYVPQLSFSPEKRFQRWESKECLAILIKINLQSAGTTHAVRTIQITVYAYIFCDSVICSCSNVQRVLSFPLDFNHIFYWYWVCLQL